MTQYRWRPRGQRQYSRAESIPGIATLKRQNAIKTPVYLALRRAGLEDKAEEFLRRARDLIALPLAEYRREVTAMAREYCAGDIDLLCDVAAAIDPA